MLFTDQLIEWMNCYSMTELLEKHLKENSLLPTSCDMAHNEEEVFEIV